MKKVKSSWCRLKGQGGFTLIELLIVIAIMGFLVAMIAPRLAGIAGHASDVICDNNQVRLRQVLAAYNERTGQYPNNLTSLVYHDKEGKAVDPSDHYDAERGLGTGWYVDDNNRANGQEVLSKDFYAMTRLGLLTLNEDEARELIQLGVSRLYYLNVNQDVEEMEYVGNEVKKLNENIPEAGAGNRYMQPVEVKKDVHVLAVGFKGDNLTLQTGHKIGHPDRIGCIVLGVGPNSDLVQEGLIQQAALCPNGIRRADHFLYNNYNIVLPRLAATSTKIVEALGGENKVKVTLVFENELTKEEKTVVIEKDTGMEPYQFTTFCPEGCNPMAPDEPYWVLKEVKPE